ncbi:extracellular solute-binding protein [Martelella sp. AMO21009]
MMRIAMKALLCTALLAGLHATIAKSGDLNVYCDLPARQCRALADAFMDANPLDVGIFPRASGREALQKSDILLAPPDSELLEDGVLETAGAVQLNALRVWARRPFEQSRGRFVGLYASILGFVVNTELMRQRQLNEPACWADLLRPELSAEIRMGDPTVSETGYRVLASLVQIFGEDAAFDYLKRLQANLALNVISEASAAEAVAEGDFAIAVVNLGDGISLATKGYPVKLIAPCEGTGYAPVLMAILKNAPHPQNARNFYSFSLSAGGQSASAAALGYPLPSNTGATLPSSSSIAGPVRLIDYDFGVYDTQSERKRLTARWIDATGNAN